MQDRRRQTRKDLMSYSQVHNLQNGELIGYLGDLTELGAMVISDQLVDSDTSLHISIELPELPDIQDSTMIISVRVAYCHQDISPEYYNLGLEFNSITEKQMSIIKAVMTNYEFRRQSPNYPPHPNEMENN